MSISAFIPVFNEEKRIETALKTIQWCDEIILLDKQSSDRTREIAEALHAKVFKMPNSSSYDSSEFEYLLNHCSSEWVLLFTASDVIHPELAREIKKLTSDKDFPYDVIYVPLRRYVLGLETKRSPWYSENAPMVVRKSVIRINKTGVHNALVFDSTRHYKMKKSNEYCMYHLTHETVDKMMDRHTRYWRGEGQSATGEGMKAEFLAVLKAIWRTYVARKVFLMGWKGMMLGFAYMSYVMMSFVYRWEHKYSEAANTYKNIRKRILMEWENKIYNDNF